METPGAGPSRLQAPITPKPRRRSWFHFGPSSSTSAPPPLPRSSEDLAQEDLELGPITPRQSRDTTRPPLQEEREDEEVLTIDGELDEGREGSIRTLTKKKKKKRRSNGHDEGEGEVVRMMDLKPHAAALGTRRPSDSSGISDRTQLGLGSTNSYSTRTFSRTASDRIRYGQGPGPELVKPPPRTSSIPSQPQFHRTPSGSSNKDQPLLPSDRPLPPLPPTSAPATTPPTAPTGIFVTPSSPIKATHETSTTSFGAQADRIHPPLDYNRERRSSSSDSLRTPHQQHPRLQRSPIGLGLPGQLTPDFPPPVPSKRQSVSSPIPTRSSSPHKISFAEPREATDDRGRVRPEEITERRQKVRRARSLSGIFKSSPVIDRSPTMSGPATPDMIGDDDHRQGGGVLEWLGVRKAVKRRQSETHLRHKPDPSPDVQQVPRIPSPVPRVSTDSHKKGKSPHTSFVDLTGLRRSSDSSKDRQGQASRPSSRNSTTRPIPAQAIPSSSSSTSTSRLGSLFTRRASKHPDGASPSPPASLPSHNTLSHRERHDSGVASSRSSFSLPPFDPVVSPIYPTSGPWMSSPGTETEEMLFSPEGSNWGPGIRPWMDGTEAQPQRSARSSFSSPPPEPEPVQSPGLIGDQRVDSSSKGQEGRARSHSDAPHVSAQSTSEENGRSSPGPETGVRLATSLHTTPVVPGRPKMGNRANSGNAAIIDRMKTVFARSSSRQRASTMLPDAHVHGAGMDEFGVLRNSNEWPSNSSSVSGTGSSPRKDDIRLSYDERPQQDGGRASTRSSLSLLPGVTRRPRASTVSVGPTTQAFTTAPPSPVIYPAAATPPRRRPSAIRKLSNTLLGAASKPSSPKSSSLFPLPPRSSGSVSSGLTASGFHWDRDKDDTSSVGTSMSPRPSLGSIAAVTPGPPSNIKQLAARVGEETSDDYVKRISQVVPRNEISGVLATSSDPFYTECMRLYMARFDFKGVPLDVALRQLLMHMSLPKETQQIDRVVEAFAVRYEQCEPDLFKDKDNTYVVAFSMMMLHTDAFNKHNKHKMSKTDYVRNTRMEGVSPLVLETFYDNITFSPFVFIENDGDLLPKTTTTPGTETLASSFNQPSGLMGPPRSGKVDVYHTIVNHLLHTLRIHVDRQIPLDNPFSTIGSDQGDIESLHAAFAKARLVQVTLPGRRKTSTGILSSTPTRGAPPTEVMLKITKVGVLSRTDDLDPTTKKAVGNRKWKNWSVVLTGSQLLFVKDAIMAMSIIEQIKRAESLEPQAPVKLSILKPDEVVPLKHCIAVYDHASARIHSNPRSTFRLVMPNSRTYLLSASDDKEMNNWIALVNYASTFKTAGIRMRGISMRKEQVVLAGAAAAASHKRNIQVIDQSHSYSGQAKGIDISTPKKAVFGAHSQIHTQFLEPSPIASKSSQESDRSKHDITTSAAEVKGVEVDDADGVVANEGEQLEEVFDEVKAELAAGRGSGTGVTRPVSAVFDNTTLPRPTSKSITQQAGSRTSNFQTQIDHFSAKRSDLFANLNTALTTVRNLSLLTPFQKTSRERISQSIPSLALQIKNDRIQLSKYDHYIAILSKELEKEQQEWATVRHVALQAAAKSLRDPKGVKAVVDDLNQPVNRIDLPKLSLPDSQSLSDSLSPSPLSPSPLPSPWTGTSPGEWPIQMLRSDSHTSSTGKETQERDKKKERQGSITSPIPRSESSFVSIKSDLDAENDLSKSRSTSRNGSRSKSVSGNTTGRSTPIMFNLSESENEFEIEQDTEDHARTVGKKTRGGNRNEDKKRNDDNDDTNEIEMKRGGTLKAKTKNPVKLAPAMLDHEEAGLSVPRKRREREVTAVYIGPTLEPVSGQTSGSQKE